MQRHKTTGAIKTALKERQVKECLRKLDRAKSTLLIAHQTYMHEHQKAAQERQQKVLEEHFEAMTGQLAAMRLCSGTRSLGGEENHTIAQYLTRSGRRQPQRYKDSRWIRLPLVSLPWQYGLADTSRTWSFNLTCFVPIPPWSPIFDLCEKGDLVGIRDLLESGQASVHDRDPNGRTLLHVSGGG